MNTDDLVDINDVVVNTALPKEERMRDFIRQIKNPYRFKCGDLVFNIKFTDDGPTLEDCLTRLILREIR